MDAEALRDRRVLVVGLGVTGLSVVRFLLRQSIAFDVADECGESAAQLHRRELDALCSSMPAPQFYRQFDAAVFSGYDVLILSPGVPRAQPAVAAAIESGIAVIGDIELFAGHVRAPVIAVTGSNGKSTVVSWLASALNQAGIKTVACGNIGQPALDSLLVETELFVLELSSYQLESTFSLKALSGAVLNVSDDHLDRYDDMDHYASVKRHLHGMSDHVVANLEDARTWPTDSAVKRCEYFTTSLDRADGQARWHRAAKGNAVHLCDADQWLMNEAELYVPGEHNVANALAVLALSAPLGVGFDALYPGLTNYRGLAHRSQYVGERGGVRWYNDSKGTNVDACSKAITAMPGPVLLIAGGMSKGADFTPLNDLLRQCVRLLILMGRDRERMAQQMSGATDIVLADDLDEAVRIASERAQAGDVVLLSPACSSFDMFRNFEDRGDRFVAAVEQVLAA